MSVVALSTLFSNPFWSLCLIPSGSGDIMVSPCVRLSVCPSICLSVWLSITNSCEHNSSYSFSRIFLKLCVCFCQGLKMCMTFGCNPQIIIFFHSSDFVIFDLEHLDVMYLVNSFNRIFLKLCSCFVKVWRCAWHLAVINPQTSVCPFLSQFAVSHFWAYSI